MNNYYYIVFFFFFLGNPPSKMRYSSGQPAALRQPVKAGLSTSSLLNSKQPIKSSGYNSTSSLRKMQSSPGLIPAVPGAVSRSGNFPPTMKHSGGKAPSSAGCTTPKSKMMQPSKRQVFLFFMLMKGHETSWLYSAHLLLHLEGSRKYILL